jgi:endoglucanase
MRRPLALLVSLLAVLVLAAPAAAKHVPTVPPQPSPTPAPKPTPTPLPAPAPRDWQAVNPSAANPLLGVRFFVDWYEQPAAKWFKRYQRAGQPGSAGLMYEIASQPIFRWIGKTDRNPERNTRVFLQRAAERAPGTVPGITVLAHQGESCKHGYTGGGGKLDSRYRRWFKRFAKGLGNNRAIVALEPDGLGTLKCLRGSRRLSRLRNMRFATQLLSKKPNVTTYIDAGASDWRPAGEMARYLRASGVSRVRGFALNITHFDTDANNLRYGMRISRMLGGKHFVINSDENGRGRVWYRRWINRAANLWKTVNVWCNPKRSGLGTRPVALAHPRLDGYLWMSRPAASAGKCRGWNPRYSMRGGPNAGTFWPKRALLLARQSNP